MMTTTAHLEVPAAAAAATPRYGFAALRRAARIALQWRLLLLWTVLLLAASAAAALPVWQLLKTSLDHSVYAPRLATALDLSAIADLAEAARRYGTAIGDGGLVALALTLLLSPLLSGMTVAAARAPQQLGITGLLAGGVQEYPRLARMLLWAVVPLGIAAVLGGVALHAANKYGQSAILAADADHAGWLALAVLGLLLAAADASLDAGRAMLAVDRRRKSAVLAWWRGCGLLARRPLATLGTWLGISAVGLALAALAAVARLNVPALGIGGFIGAFALAQLAVVLLAWTRSARLCALMELARAPR